MYSIDNLHNIYPPTIPKILSPNTYYVVQANRSYHPAAPTSHHHHPDHVTSHY